MTLLNFLNNTVDIIEQQITRVSWEDVITPVPIYTWIKAHYYKAVAKLDETWLASNTQLTNYRVIIEPSNVLAKEWMHLIIYDPDMWTIWTFIIKSQPKMNRLINWTNDSIEINVKPI